jgi:hypothetical protein
MVIRLLKINDQCSRNKEPAHSPLGDVIRTNNPCCRILQGNGPIRQVETCPDSSFTARVHTTKSTVKILAANTHCEYSLKIAEVTHFSVRGTACISTAHNSRVSLDLFNIRLAVLSVAYCPGSATGGHFSKGLAGYNIGNVRQFLKNTCSAF